MLVRQNSRWETLILDCRLDLHYFRPSGNWLSRAKQLHELIENPNVIRLSRERTRVEREISLSSGNKGRQADAKGIAGSQFGDGAERRPTDSSVHSDQVPQKYRVAIPG